MGRRFPRKPNHPVKPSPDSPALTGQDLGTVGPLSPGVYTFDSSAGLTGNLYLDFGGASNVNFVFRVGSTLTTASNSNVYVEGAGTNDNVYWQVGSSATLGTGTNFVGDIVALASVTLNTGATISCGGAIALNGAVTMDSNNVGVCSGGTQTIGNIPEPASLLLLGVGLVGVAATRRTRTAKFAAGPVIA